MAMKKILRFLSGIQKFGIFLGRISNYSISRFCDADWEVRGHTTDRKSQTCILISLCG